MWADAGPKGWMHLCCTLEKVMGIVVSRNSWLRPAILQREQNRKVDAAMSCSEHVRESRDMRKLNSCEIGFVSLAAELNAHLLHCRILYHVFNTKRRGLEHDEGEFGIYQVGPSLNADCRGSC
jgi:hypothetical protein